MEIFHQSPYENKLWRRKAVNDGWVMHERPGLLCIAKNESVFSFNRRVAHSSPPLAWAGSRP